jgi:hypothetical protein
MQLVGDRKTKLNGKIVLSVFISFLLVFSSLFYIHFSSIPEEQENNQYEHFSQTLNNTSTNFFVLGSSHVGQLNSSLIVNSIHNENYNFNIFNLATNGDKPDRRVSNISDIIDLNPKIIFYGISYRDFVSTDTITQKYAFLDIKLLLKESIPEDLESLNPQLVSRRMIRDALDNYGIIDISEFDIRPVNTPFFSLGNLQTIILEESALQRLILTVQPPPQTLQISVLNNEQIDSFKKIIEKLQANEIKVVIFTTPLHDFYLKEIPSETHLIFNGILDDISNEYDVKVYNFTAKYSGLKVWNNLDHIAYNENSNQFSNDVSEMILMELNE